MDMTDNFPLIALISHLWRVRWVVRGLRFSSAQRSGDLWTSSRGMRPATVGIDRRTIVLRAAWTRKLVRRAPAQTRPRVEKSLQRQINLLRQGRLFVTEHRLFFEAPEEDQIWGNMPADLIYSDPNASRVVLFKNKIGGSVGYGPEPGINQFARQIEFLSSLQRRPTPRRTALILITGK